MSDLISRNALLKYCRKVVEYDEAGYSVTFNAVSVEDIKNEPTVESKDVVHCKDCEYSTLPAVLTMKYGKKGTLTCHNRYSPCNNRNVNENDFCSYGADMRKNVK